jgi:hypothetical protein
MENTTMTKTLMIATALLTFGVGSAFASEQFPDRTPLPASSAISHQAGGHGQAYVASTQGTTNVYSQFSRPGWTQGGNQ